MEVVTAKTVGWPVMASLLLQMKKTLFLLRRKPHNPHPQQIFFHKAVQQIQMLNYLPQ
jgi:hypothetical protein